MKIASSILVVLTLSAIDCPAGEASTYRQSFDEAKHYGAKTKIVLRVVDDHEIPVSNATVSAVLNPSWNARKYTTISKETETNGIAILEGTTIFPYIGGSVNKDGYYQSGYKLRFGDSSLHDNGGESSKEYYDSKVKDGCWLPWNPTIPVVLREIRNPMPMYVKKVALSLPNGAFAGFDCEIGDFVEPYGKGKIADFNIRVAIGGTPYKKTTKTISISAVDPEGGFSVLKHHLHSVFKSEYLAPEAGYSTNMIATSTYDMQGEGFKGSALYEGGEYLVFKSRIKRDRDGKIISANYGKVYDEMVSGFGDDKLLTAGVEFLYYFNPKPNDRSLEFDGNNNLFSPQDTTSQYAP